VSLQENATAYTR